VTVSPKEPSGKNGFAAVRRDAALLLAQESTAANREPM
jgi:hypothetical protein